MRLHNSLVATASEQRAAEQLDLEQIRGEMRKARPGARISSRVCAEPGCGRHLRLGWANEFCGLHWRRKAQGDNMNNVKASPGKRARAVKAYTIERRGGGWVMLTLLADETSVVDESQVDSRQAQFTRIEDELRRLE